MNPAAAALFLSLVSPVRASPYDDSVMADAPVMYLRMDTPSSGAQADASGGGRSGSYVGGAPAADTMPNGDGAAAFNGLNQYLTVPHHPSLSAPTKGALTIEAWIKPATLQFSRTENEDYVYFLGKGNASQGYEYANRMYSYSNSAGRPNRISVYHWNPSGGLGSGSYFQDVVSVTQWILVTSVIDMGTATIAIYKNGVLRQRVPLSQYGVTPQMTSAPFNVGTRNYNSWFQGSIGKVAVYDKILSPARIAAHYAAMGLGAPPAPIPNPGTAPAAPRAAAKDQLAPQRILSPGLADGRNDRAVFGPQAARVTIHDARGRRVFDESRSGGPIVWNGRDSSGRVVASGAYIATVRADGGDVAYQSFAVAR